MDRPPYPGDDDTAYHSRTISSSHVSPTEVYPENDSSLQQPIPSAPHRTPSSSDQASVSKIHDQENPSLPKKQRLSKKWKKRLYWMIPLGILSVVLLVLFEVYRSNFEKWLSPLADWLRARESWSWVLPVLILVLISFPPLFGHEIVMLLVGLTYPIGVGVGIACAGAIIGEAACFVVFKYFFTSYVERKIKEKIKWAATARVTQDAGFRGVLIIRYSIVPPHLVNPLFSCTGMKFWLYMLTVILSLPKTIIFVILGSPSAKNSTAAKWGKVVAIGVLVIITIFASIWIRKKTATAIKLIEAERAEAEGDELHGMLGADEHLDRTTSGRSSQYDKSSLEYDMNLKAVLSPSGRNDGATSQVNQLHYKESPRIEVSSPGSSAYQPNWEPPKSDHSSSQKTGMATYGNLPQSYQYGSSISSPMQESNGYNRPQSGSSYPGQAI